MFKRIAITLLAASATAYGKSIGANVKAATANTAVTANTAATTVDTTAAAAAPAQNTANTAVAPAANAPVTSQSRFTEAELAAASPAKVFQNCQKPGQFVLTFDDGPNPQTTPIALEYLRNNNLKATFFINGVNYGDVNNQATVDLIKQEYNEGHDIASHTFYHKDLFEAIQEGTMETNIDMMTDKIQELIGVKPAFFRPPNGNGAYQETDPVRKGYNDKVQKYLGASGYSIIMWGTDTRDWDFKDNVDAVIAELNKQLAAPGVSPATHSFISLMHDVHPTTVNTVLPAVVEYVKSLGYQFVSLTECLGMSSAYQGVVNTDPNSNLNANTSAANGAVAGATTGATAGTTANETAQQEKSAASHIQIEMLSTSLVVLAVLLYLF